MRRIRVLFSAEGKKPLLVKRQSKLCPFIPGCCSCRRKSLARESVVPSLSGQWLKWRESILNRTMKRPCLFAEHCSGGGKTPAILAEFSSENHLLAPFSFLLKSRPLRQFFRQYGVPFRPTRRLDRLSASLSNLRRSTKRLCNDERWYRSSGILKTGALLHQTPPGEWYENQNFPGAFAPKPSNR